MKLPLNVSGMVADSLQIQSIRIMNTFLHICQHHLLFNMSHLTDFTNLDIRYCCNLSNINYFSSQIQLLRDGAYKFEKKTFLSWTLKVFEGYSAWNRIINFYIVSSVLCSFKSKANSIIRINII